MNQWVVSLGCLAWAVFVMWCVSKLDKIQEKE